MCTDILTVRNVKMLVGKRKNRSSAGKHEKFVVDVAMSSGNRYAEVEKTLLLALVAAEKFVLY